jgi:dolichol-phosphate mannosyltransferase
MISVVIPVYNEERNISPICERLLSASHAWEMPFEVIFVDDGSTDDTSKEIRTWINQNPRFKLIQLSRNFGHQASISAGLEHSTGQATVVMDADLQDPPEVIIKFIEKWQSGFKVAYGIRTKRKEVWYLRLAYSFFYRLLDQIGEISIPMDSGDFCLMDRQVVDIIVNEMPEKHRFIRGLRSYTGFKQVGIPFERAERLHGKSNYTLRKLIGLALNGLFGFSTFPLRLSTYIGSIVALLALSTGVFFIAHRIIDFKILGYSPADVPGLASLAVGLFFLGGLTLMMLGVIGEYLGRIYMEIKRRPLFIVKEVVTNEINGQ